MSKKDKLKQSLLKNPSKYKWSDLVLVMKHCGFNVFNAKGGGSGRKFYNPDTGKAISWHEPHPGNEVTKYVITQAIALIKEHDNEK